MNTQYIFHYPNFSMIASARCRKSWVSRWQRIEKYEPGVYAVAVFGRLPEDVEETLIDNGLSIRRRDGTTTAPSQSTY